MTYGLRSQAQAQSNVGRSCVRAATLRTHIADLPPRVRAPMRVASAVERGSSPLRPSLHGSMSRESSVDSRHGRPPEPRAPSPLPDSTSFARGNFQAPLSAIAPSRPLATAMDVPLTTMRPAWAYQGRCMSPTPAAARGAAGLQGSPAHGFEPRTASPLRAIPSRSFSPLPRAGLPTREPASTAPVRGRLEADSPYFRQVAASRSPSPRPSPQRPEGTRSISPMPVRVAAGAPPTATLLPAPRAVTSLRAPAGPPGMAWCSPAMAWASPGNGAARLMSPRKAVAIAAARVNW